MPNVSAAVVNRRLEDVLRQAIRDGHDTMAKSARDAISMLKDLGEDVTRLSREDIEAVLSASKGGAAGRQAVLLKLRWRALWLRARGERIALITAVNTQISLINHAKQAGAAGVGLLLSQL